MDGLKSEKFISEIRSVTEETVFGLLKNVWNKANKEAEKQNGAVNETIINFLQAIAPVNTKAQFNKLMLSSEQLNIINSILRVIDASLSKESIDELTEDLIWQATEELNLIINEPKKLRENTKQYSEVYNQELIKKLENTSHELKNQKIKADQITEVLQYQVDYINKQISEIKQEQSEQFQNELNYSKNKHEIIWLKSIEDYYDLSAKAKELLSFTQGKALSNFFEKRAKQEKISAENWTSRTWLFAILTLLAIVSVFIYQIWYFSPENKSDISLLGTKVLFTATLGLIAKWTSKRANRHLAEESKYHRLSVNISTIDAFVEKLDEKARNEVLAAVAMKTFTEVNGNDTATDFETASVLDFIKSALPKTDGK